MKFREAFEQARLCKHYTEGRDTVRRTKPAGHLAKLPDYRQAEVFKEEGNALIVFAERPVADKIFLRQTGRTYPVMLLCPACVAELPTVAGQRAVEKEIAEKRAATAATEAEEMVERFNAGESLFLCTDCEEIRPEDELVPVRSCPHCEENFDASDGRNCTACNRPFSAKVSEAGCPECLEDEGLEPVTDIEILKERLDA